MAETDGSKGVMIDTRQTEVHIPEVAGPQSVRHYMIGDRLCIEPAWLVDHIGPKRSLHRNRVFAYWPEKQTTRQIGVIIVAIRGRHVPRGHHVHHINHVGTDNRLENLEVISPEKHLEEHTSLFRDENGNWMKSCTRCGVVAPASDGNIWSLKRDDNTGQTHLYSGKCHGCRKYEIAKQRRDNRIHPEQSSLF